jgi:MoaA/NifB/PqqE/SkfB family radical SAM enzyme
MSDSIDLLRSRVDFLVIEVTSKCNLRCSYCHKADDVLEAMPGSNDDMSDEMIDGLYRYCKQADIRKVMVSLGGETTMHADWHRRIARFLDDPDIETSIVSNFVRLLTDEDLEALTKFENLQVSFDSSDLAMVRKLRSRADLRTITYNIIRLRQKGRELGRMPRLVVNCTVCRDNVGHIGKLAGFCRELGVDQLLLTEVMPITDHNTKMPEMLDCLTDEEVIRLVREVMAAKEILQGSATQFALQEHFEAKIAELIEQIAAGITPSNPAAYFHRRMVSSACLQPWVSPMVRADGKVLPCCGHGFKSIGDLKTATMDEIVDGDAYRAIRASILEGRPTVQCQTCSLVSRMSFPEFVRVVRECQASDRIMVA